MGLFDSLKDAIRPDDDPSVNDPSVDDPSGDSVSAPGTTPDSPKHVDESAPPEFIGDPNELENPTGGKHARRD